MKRLAELRKEHNLNQSGLALKLNLSQYLISSYENGRHQPSIEMLIKFAEFFNVSVDYLIGKTDVRSPKLTHQSDNFSKDEIALLDYYDELTKEQKEIALGVLHALKEYKKHSVD